MHLIVEEIERLGRVGARTYRFSKASSGSWPVSYDVRVNGRQHIISTSDLSISVPRGNIISRTLTHNNKRMISNGQLVVN
ncbi:DUF5626 family protein [Enterococcus lactis]|uniref:DUF5626 family protein n=1 Tax=Enterococcus lactis TaxID=357441 RepID=UPI003A4DAA3E